VEAAVARRHGFRWWNTLAVVFHLQEVSMHNMKHAARLVLATGLGLMAVAFAVTGLTATWPPVRWTSYSMCARRARGA